MKKIAVITGASSGMGKEFVVQIEALKEPLDEVWVIARRLDRLEALKCAFPIKAISLDLTDRTCWDTYQKLLESEKPEVRLLVNASGYGKFDSFMGVNLSTDIDMVDLNCQALQAMCYLTIPYMGEDSHIVNISSMAAFQPIPYIAVYGATKAFVLSLSRAINQELRKQKVHVMALCPFWTKTEFFSRAIDQSKDAVVKKYVAMYDADKVVKNAYQDVRKNKEVSLYGAMSKIQAFLCKIFPHSFVMKVWLHQQKL